jgi:nucleoside-diphosphate-sugar epimerase
VANRDLVRLGIILLEQGTGLTGMKEATGRHRRDLPPLRRRGAAREQISPVRNDAECRGRCRRCSDRGPRTTTLYSTAARNIASAMDDQGVRRLVFLSNFGVLGEKGSGARTAAVVFTTKLPLGPTLEDHRRALDELRKRNWEWIAVRPMRLTNGPRTGHHRVAVDGLPRGGARISRADVADLMLKQVTSSEYVHRIPAIAY